MTDQNDVASPPASPPTHAPTPASVPPRPGSGAPDPGRAVADVLGPLDALDDAPLAQHVDAFDSVHAGLQRLLAEPER